MAGLNSAVILIAFNFFICGYANEVCDEEFWKSCKNQLWKLKSENGVENYLNGNISQFCIIAEQNGSCWRDISQACKEKYPIFVADMAAYMSNKNLFCDKETDYATLYRKVSPCYATKEDELGKCNPTEELNENEPVTLNGICRRSMNFLLCLTNISKRLCGTDGETFGAAYERSIRYTFAEICQNEVEITTVISN